jgi:hypothetical protein
VPVEAPAPFFADDKVEDPDDFWKFDEFYDPSLTLEGFSYDSIGEKNEVIAARNIDEDNKVPEDADDLAWRRIQNRYHVGRWQQTIQFE